MTAPAPSLGTRVGHVVDGTLEELRAAGVLAANAMRDLPGPGVLLLPPVLHWRFGGCVRVDMTAVVIGGAGGQPLALGPLVDLLDQVAAVLGAPWEVALPIDQSLASGQIAPAYQVQWSENV
jgi:hypothetical protein